MLFDAFCERYEPLFAPEATIWPCSLQEEELLVL
jgi:hypothetical protein